MTKTICDICGNDMPLEIYSRALKDYKFCISSNGKAWDICNECREKLNKWINERKTESEAVRYCTKAESEAKGCRL